MKMHTSVGLLPPPFKHLMTEHEVADLIGYKSSTLSSRRSRGISENEMPMPQHIKVCGKVRYRGHDVYDYMLKHELITIDERPMYTQMVVAEVAKNWSVGLPDSGDDNLNTV